MSQDNVDSIQRKDDRSNEKSDYIDGLDIDAAAAHDRPLIDGSMPKFTLSLRDEATRVIHANMKVFIPVAFWLGAALVTASSVADIRRGELTLKELVAVLLTPPAAWLLGRRSASKPP